MIRMTLREAAASLGASCEADLEFTGIATDSRATSPGMLFAALTGERVDGHEFVAQAVDSGACAVLVGRRVDTPVPQLVVDDVLLALGKLAQAWRERLDPTVIAITGSNGKTTTREMTAQILGQEGRVLSTRGNFNNELGLPLTLFGLEETHRFAVLELGASKAGDIRYLAGIAKPDVGVVTNVGPAHLRGFGDEEGVARAKGELYTALPAEGFAVINDDEPWSDLWRSLCTAGEVLTFGSSADCDVRVEQDGGKQRMFTPAGEFGLRLHLPGDHNVQNAMAAAALATALGIDNERIRAGLEATRPVPGRLNLIHAPDGWTVIDDTYNANPASLYAALQVLTSERAEPWLVLGDMKELGSSSRKLHAEMGEAASALGVRRLFAVGEVTPATVDVFGAGATHYPDHESLIEALRAELHDGVACLVKGSRSMAMERVVQAISGSGDAGEAR